MDFKHIPLWNPEVQMESREDGSIYLKTNQSLAPHPERITERLVHWAQETPERVFLGQREDAGPWNTLTYAQTWERVQRLGQYLLQSPCSQERPLVILSGNSLEHGLLALAAMHVGIPYAPVSPAYSLRSTDFGKLKYCINLMTPGVLFVQNGKTYKRALEALDLVIPTIAVEEVLPEQVPFHFCIDTSVGSEVKAASQEVQSCNLTR